MKKLNNKGITTIEVLICFVLIVIISISMYNTVSIYNERRIIEGYKQEVTSYKNILTKMIQDDFIKIGLTHATYERKIADSDGTVTHVVTCNLKDGTNRQLIIEQRIGYSNYHISGAKNQSDKFMIRYGIYSEDPTKSDIIEYPIPDLGEIEIPANPSLGVTKHTVKDLSINNVLISIEDDSVLSIYIGFYHPELTTRYAISIVCPIDFTSTGTDGTKKWDY